MPTIPKQARIWLDNAKDDLATAKAMLCARRYNYTAFMGQQCLEKLLKGIYILRKNEPPPYIHDLVKLGQRVEIDIPDGIQTSLAAISNHYIAARYGEVRSNYNRQIAEDVLAKTEEVYQWFIETQNLNASSKNSRKKSNSAST